MKIIDILTSKESTLSFEFFPPKNKEKEDLLFKTIGKLAKYSPDFASITYSPTGLSKEKSIMWSKSLKQNFNIEPMMHITCISSTKEDVINITQQLQHFQIKNILALRGDILDKNVQLKNPDFSHAVDLIKFIRSLNDFCIGCAGYPEGHIECKSIEKDIDYLYKKIEAGAQFIITQLFFDNSHFYNFMNLIFKKGIKVPVICGIMPITSLNQIIKFTKICGATIPKELEKKLHNKSDKYVFDIGIEYTIKQCIDLINNGFKRLHFYTLNNSKSVELILSNIYTIYQNQKNLDN
jgi:methylenetetrahydrofolate reductase (NADPH)